MYKYILLLSLLFVAQPIGAQNEVKTIKQGSATVFKQEDVVPIVVPETLDLVYSKTYEPGEIIIIEVGNTNFKNFTWQVVGPPGDNTFRVINNGSAVVVRSTEGEYNVFCAGSKEDGKITSEVANFLVGKKKPPTPIVVPDGFQGLTKLAYTAAPPGSKAIATKLAASYRKVSGQIKKTDSAESIAILLRTENRVTIDAEEIAKFNDWGKAINDKMTKLAKDNLVVTPDQHIEAFKAIADGLEFVQ